MVHYKKERCAVLHIGVCFFVHVSDLLSILQSDGNWREKDKGKKPYRVDTDGPKVRWSDVVQGVPAGGRGVVPSDTQAL